MSRNLTPYLVNKTCSSCRHSVPEESFFRKGKVWKICNECSAKASRHRKTQSVFVYDHLGQRMEAMYIGQPFGQEMTDFVADQQLTEELRYEQDQFEQQRLEQHQFEHDLQQSDSRMTVVYILNDTNLYEYTPSELNEQQRRLIHHTQQLYDPQSSQAYPDKQLMFHQNTEPELFVEQFPNCPLDPTLGELPPHELLLDTNFYAQFGTNGAEQVDCSWLEAFSPDDLVIDFDECLASLQVDSDFGFGFDQSPLDLDLADQDVLHALQPEIDSSFGFGQSLPELDLVGNDILRVDSMVPTVPDAGHNAQWVEPSNGFDNMMDIDMPDSALGFNPDVDLELAATQEDTPQISPEELQAEHVAALLAQRKTSEKQVRKPCSKPAPYSLAHVFANFNASEDILRQPATSTHAEDLTGEALAAHLITEFGLAVRLAELHGRWRKMKQVSFLHEVGVLNRLENKADIMPWGPLSDWLTLCENELEEIIDTYGYGKNLNWKLKKQVALCKKRLAKTIKSGLRKAAVELMDQNTEALLKLFSTDSEVPENMIKKELDRQLRSLQNTIAQDCRKNGILRLNVGPHGTYTMR